MRYAPKLINWLLLTTLPLSGLNAQNTLQIETQAPEISISHWIANAPKDGKITGRPLVLEFWATWCGPCVAAVPHLNSLQEIYGPKGVQFVSLTNEPMEKVQRTLAKIDFRSAVATDLSDSTQIRYGDGIRGLKAYPMTVLIDSQGIIKWVGEPKRLSPKILDAFLDGSLQGSNAFMPSGSRSASENNTSQPQGSFTLGDLSTLSVKDFYILTSSPRVLESFHFALSKTSPEKATATSSGDSHFLIGQTMPNIFSAVFNKEVCIDDSMSDFTYDLLYVNRNPSSSELQNLESRLLGAINAQLEPELISRAFLQVSIVDSTKLTPSGDALFSTVSDADGKLLINGFPLGSALSTYAEQQAHKPIYEGSDQNRYDLILSTTSEGDLIRDLESYGLAVERIEKQVEVYHLLAEK